VKEKQTVQAEQPHERCSRQRVRHRLSKIQAVGIWVLAFLEVHVGKRLTHPYTHHFAALQEDSAGPGMIEPGEALEILAVKCQIGVVGRAQRCGNVGRLIAFDAVTGSRHVHRHRERRADGEKDEAKNCGTDMA
jgi:hypothetical protein